MYTVKQLADLAGLSRRTLHYYDEVGLLTPSQVESNGYRSYDEMALFRLQQILFYREIGLELQEIKNILDNPDFDLLSALQSHRQMLAFKIQRLQTLRRTVDTTIAHLIGEIDMSKKNVFEGFSEEKQKGYEQEAIAKWGDTAKQSIRLWQSYGKERQQEIMQEGSDIYQEIVANMDKGSNSAEIQALLGRWHQHLHYFYEPTPEILAGLGNMYDEHPDFNATFAQMHPHLPAFLKEAITRYVAGLSTA